MIETVSTSRGTADAALAYPGLQSGRPGLGVEVGYRGIAAMWQPRTPDQTSLLGEGIYLTVSIR